MINYNNSPKKPTVPNAPINRLADVRKQLDQTQTTGPNSSSMLGNNTPNSVSALQPTTGYGGRAANGMGGGFAAQQPPPPPAPPATTPPPAAPAPPPDTSALEQQWVNSMLDPTKEDDLIKQLMGDQIGGNAVNNRAAMGRAGFGSSGALAGMNDDAARQAQLAAAGATNQWNLQAGQAGINADINLKNQGMQDALNQALVAYMNANGGAAPGASGGDAMHGAIPGIVGDPSIFKIIGGAAAHSGLAPTTSSTLADAGAPKKPASVPTQTTKDKLPPGSKQTDKEGNITYYTAPDGSQYYVVG